MTNCRSWSCVRITSVAFPALLELNRDPNHVDVGLQAKVRERGLGLRLKLSAVPSLTTVGT